jgi:hypothetical protein
MSRGTKRCLTTGQSTTIDGAAVVKQCCWQALIVIPTLSGGGSAGSNPAGGTSNTGNINSRAAGTRRHLSGVSTGRLVSMAWSCWPPARTRPSSHVRCRPVITDGWSLRLAGSSNIPRSRLSATRADQQPDSPPSIDGLHHPHRSRRVRSVIRLGVRPGALFAMSACSAAGVARQWAGPIAMTKLVNYMWAAFRDGPALAFELPCDVRELQQFVNCGRCAVRGLATAFV